MALKPFPKNAIWHMIQRGQAANGATGMENCLARALSTVGRRRPLAIMAFPAMAALMALGTDAAIAQVRPGQNQVATTTRPAQSQVATAPRPAGDPIMAIVSIKTQQVTLYDA